MLGDIQDVKRQVMLALVSEAFTAQIAAVDAEKGFGVTPIPVAVFPAERRNIAGLGFPIGEVIGLRTTYVDEDSASVDATHEIAVMWTHVGDDELIVTRDLERLVRATREFLDRHVIAALNMGPMRIVSEDYSELSRRPEGSGFVKGASSMLEVTTY